MSRGFGKIERAVLDALEKSDRLVDTFTLAAMAFDLKPVEEQIIVADAQLVSVRRALRSLERQGKVFAVMRGHNKRAYWANERLGLWYAVRVGQQRSVALAGDPAALMQHADRLVKLIKRANELGVDFNSKLSRNPDSFSRAVPSGLVIYCDGACEPNPGAGGWGFVVYRDGTEVHANCGGSSPTTNNVMELTGALRALEWFIDQRTQPTAVQLFCDSMYVVNGCNEWRHSWKTRGWRRKGKDPEIANLDLWKELDAALIRIPIKLEWCKGHAGITGNERADELSLEGREAILALQPDPIEEQLRYVV